MGSRDRKFSFEDLEVWQEAVDFELDREAQLDKLKGFGDEIGKMLSGLIRSIKTSKS